MVTLKGVNIFLRALEPEDLDFVYEIENDENIWELSHTQTPYSRFLIKQYLEEAHKDIYEAKQLRLVISDSAPRSEPRPGPSLSADRREAARALG